MINAECPTSTGPSTRAQTIIYYALAAIRIWNITVASGNFRIFRSRINSIVSWRSSIWVSGIISMQKQENQLVFVVGLPMLFYGLAAIRLISHKEIVRVSDEVEVPIYFLYAEDKGARFWIYIYEIRIWSLMLGRNFWFLLESLTF